MTIHAGEPPHPAEAYDENGVDLSLVRHSLRQTPTERLRAWQSFVDVVASARKVATAPALQIDQDRDGSGLR